MSALRVLIVDDEAPARSRMRRLLDPYVEAGRLGPVDEAAATGGEGGASSE